MRPGNVLIGMREFAFMKKLKISFIERKFNYFVSVEKVFRLIERDLDKDRFETSFQQLPQLNNFFGIVKNLVRFRPQNDADIYHVTGHCHYIALVLPPERTVLTIHDLGFLHTRKGFRRWLLKKLLLDLPLKRLRYVTAVSHATRDEIEANVADCAGKVRVIDNPLDDFFTAEDKKEFDSTTPNILQIGTSPNKNVHNLIRAVEGLDCRLTIVGEIGAELERLLSEKKVRYEARSELDDAAMRSEYERADIVAFCSTYEGFGLPVIEAQAMRTPVITSDISPMREVAGGGAVLSDPFDPQSIRKGILKIIADPVLRQALRDNGLKNIERFRSRTIAREYESLYREVLDNAGRES